MLKLLAWGRGHLLMLVKTQAIFQSPVLIIKWPAWAVLVE